ncbi:Epsin-3, clathrin recruitment and traffic between the Golgi and endosome [Meyerozyma guilliermondii]
MDLLKDAAKNLNLYEVKAYVRKAQNVALNLTEMEAKVREATNNEPWGAPSTLMAQIASGTYNYREREEIISFIFRRFTEKAANEWRQIYKSLQLLDYLIKNGSERLIDDVRSNVSIIQMLKSFHYIDSKGRDQGINVRNRAKNLVNFINDDAQVRAERKKARANAKKFGGVSSAAFGGASSITTGPSYGADDDFTNRVYGDGGVYGERYEDSAAGFTNGDNDNFEEYEVGTSAASNAASKPTTSPSKVNATAKHQPKEPSPDLLGDLLGGSTSTSANAAPSGTAGGNDDDDDEFDDFQAAPSQPKSNISNLADLYNTHPQQPMGFGGSQANFNMGGSAAQQQPNYNGTSSSSSAAPISVPKTNNDAFSSLFSTAKSAKPKTSTNSAKPTPPPKPSQEDSFGDFSSSTSKPNPNQTSSNNGEIDLLSF